jgi:hypothetical protein
MGRIVWTTASVAAALCCCFVKPSRPTATSDASGDGGSDGGITTPMNIMFVTSMPVDDTTLRGVSGGDIECASFAGNAGLQGTFVAWLSSGGMPVAARLQAAGTGWVRTDHKPFAMSLADLVAGRVLYPPALDERANPLLPNDLVITGTDGAGNATGLDCNAFTGSGTVTIGFWDGGPREWTAGGSAACGTHRLYCFGIDHPIQVDLAPAVGPHVFVTSSTYAPGGSGRPGLDQHCQAEGGSNYVAVVASNNESAFSHIGGLPPMPFVRFDGVAVTSDFATMTAPVALTHDGNYVDDNVFTGAAMPIVSGNGVDCSDWAGLGSAIYGESARSLKLTSGINRGFNAGTAACTGTNKRLYCVEH